MIKARQNLEKQAADLINRFEGKLQQREIKAKKLNEAIEIANYERQM